MNEKQNRTGKLSRFFEEKGFYIILFLCIAAIGIAGYVLFIAPENADTATVNANIISSLPETDNKGGAKTGQTPSGGYKAPENAASSSKDSLKPDDAEETSVSVIPSADSAKTEKKEEAVETVKNTEKNTKMQEKETVPKSESKPKQEVKTEASKENKPAAFFVKPVAGDVIRSFCVTELIYDRTMGDWRTHNGADYSAETGETVCAVADGTVKAINTDNFYGTTVIIEHDNGLESTYYGLAAEPTVKEGDGVKAGAVIGSIGKGYHFEALEPVHLHLEMKSAGKYVDPAEYIK